jgi:hypothetical protein
VRLRSRRARSALLFAILFTAYNANGRESGSADTQPAKFLAAGIALRHTLTLNAVVTERPGLAERPGFQRDRKGDWRSAYPIMPGLVASVPAVVLHTTGLVDMAAPLAPNLIAKLTASLLTAGAVVLVFLSLTRVVSIMHAWLVALGLGLGTTYWSAVSQTLGQQEVVAAGFALALWAVWRVEVVSSRRLCVAALGLALAGAARPQVVPVIVVCACALLVDAGWRRAVWPLVLVGAVGGATMGANVMWFGHVLGATVEIESVHQAVHGVSGVVADSPWANALALLISPSRGLLIFSPVVAIALLGMARRLPEDLRWLAAAIALQFVTYASYSVWWGGHSFGPRYLTDVLILLAPFAAFGVARLADRRWLAAGGWLLLLWSITVAALGAFVYPNERWNTDPLDVDRHHDRLHEWRDSQIPRAWRSDASPQNFSLFSRGALRQDGQ